MSMRECSVGLVARTDRHEAAHSHARRLVARRGIELAITMSLVGGLAVLAPGPARSEPARPAASGRAVELSYSLHPDTLRPDAPMSLMACVANVNGHASKRVEAGDTFSFEFSRGAVTSCFGVDLALPGDAMNAADWSCSVDGRTVRLTYSGEPMPWRTGQAACMKVALIAENGPTSVLVSATTGRVSTTAAGAPIVIPLGVGADVGVPGPRGPAGPAGPEGPVGATGFGQRAMVHATGPAPGVTRGPPVPVPGLRIEMATVAGAQLLLTLDTASWDCIPGGFDADAYVYLEVDGRIVAKRGLSNTADDYFKSTTIAYLTDPLPAGTHVVRGMASGWDSPTAGRPIVCIGSDTTPGNLGSLRLIAMELLP